HRVFLYTDGLTEEQATAAHMIWTRDVGATVRRLLAEYGPEATLGVLPEGPQTIPYVKNDERIPSR
nr:hypothetical protein [Dehalococcoidales bacterium]